eukprot:7672083-Ditylum_brightwellii.AAC.3
MIKNKEITVDWEDNEVESHHLTKKARRAKTKGDDGEIPAKLVDHGLICLLHGKFKNISDEDQQSVIAYNQKICHHKSIDKLDIPEALKKLFDGKQDGSKDSDNGSLKPKPSNKSRKRRERGGSFSI